MPGKDTYPSQGALPPFKPKDIVPFIERNGMGGILGLPEVVKPDPNASGDSVTRWLTGALDGLTNLSEHLLIYTIFAVLFIMLIWVFVSDQSPAEIIVNTSKTAGAVAKGVAVAS